MKFSSGKIVLFAGILSVSFVAGSFVYARAVAGAEVVDCSRTFYFLVSDSENAEAAAAVGAIGGGAGYVLSREDGEYAALSCYFTADAAEEVKDSLEGKHISASVREETGGVLYLTGMEEKRNAEKLKGCFSTLDGCIRILYDLSAGADGGKTQQSLKSLLSDVGGVLRCLANENSGGIFTDFSECAGQAYEEIGRICQGVVYAKEIRYLQVKLADSYLRLAAEFSL